MIMGIEQHLVGLKEIGPHGEGPAVAELEVRHLKLGTHATQDRPVLAPVELECLPGANDNGTNVPRPLICC